MFNEKLVQTIKKLLALANSPNEHEASRAAEKAHALLVKHNLDLQEVKEGPTRDYLRQGVAECTFQRTVEKYVAEVLEEHFFVRWTIHRRKGPRWGKNASISTWYTRAICLIGTPANVEIASYVRAFLVDKFYELWLVYKRENDVAPKFEQSYYSGLARGLNLKLTAQRHRIESERGLVLVGDKALDEFVSKIAGKGGTHTFRADEDIIADGVEHGAKIEIQRGLTSHSENKGLRLEKKES